MKLGHATAKSPDNLSTYILKQRFVSFCDIEKKQPISPNNTKRFISTVISLFDMLIKIQPSHFTPIYNQPI